MRVRVRVLNRMISVSLTEKLRDLGTDLREVRKLTRCSIGRWYFRWREWLESWPSKVGVYLRWSECGVSLGEQV